VAKRLALLMKQVLVLCDGGPALCMKAQLLEDLCNSLQQVGTVTIVSGAVIMTSLNPISDLFVSLGFDELPQEVLPLLRAADAALWRAAIMCCRDLPRLLVAVLSARKRCRDWKQPEYSRKVQAVLSISTAVLRAVDRTAQPDNDAHVRACHKMSTTALSSDESLAKVAAAQTEVAQLLLASPAGQQQLQLQQLACSLLAWSIVAHNVRASTAWYHHQASQQGIRAAAAAYLPQAAELAAVLAPTLTADSPQEHIDVFLSAALNLCTIQPEEVPEDGPGMSLLRSPAFMQLSLAMLLLQSYSAQQAACSNRESSKSSASSSIGGNNSSGSSSKCGDAGGSSSSCAGVADSSTRSCAGDARAALHEPDEAQQRATLKHVTQQLWQAAGLAPEVLALGAAALPAQLPQFYHLMESSLRGRQLRPDARTLNFERTAASLCRSIDLACTAKQKGRGPAAGAQDKQHATAVSFDQLSRQHQQLLRATTWLLPQFVLQTALLCFQAECRLTESAADCAFSAVFCWSMPGLYAAAAAGSSSSTASGAADTSSATLLPGQLVSSFADTWLQLTQALLLQPGGLLELAAATEQHLPAGSQLAQKVLGSSSCGCRWVSNVAQVPNASNTQCRTCITLSCAAQGALARLLDVLQLSAVSSTTMGDPHAGGAAWRGGSSCVALVVEVVLRRLLPHHILCSSSSSSGGSSSSESRSKSDSRQVPLYASYAAKYLHQSVVTCLSQPHKGDSIFTLLLTHCSGSYQMLSLLATFFKLWKCQPEKYQQLGLLDRLGAITGVFAKASASQAMHVEQAGSPAEVQACMSPSLLLLGQYLRAAGHWLLQQVLEGARVSNPKQQLPAKLIQMREAVRHLRLALDALNGVHNQWTKAALQAVTKQESCRDSDTAEHADQGSRQSAAQQSGKQQQQQQQEEDLWGEVFQGLAGLSRCALAAEWAGPAYGTLGKLLSLHVDEDLRSYQIVLSAAAARAAVLAGSPAGGNATTSSSSSQGPQFQQGDAMSDGETSDEEVQEALSSIKRAGTLEQCWTAAMSYDRLDQEALSLRVAGEGLCNALPVSWQCNNPDCTNMAGASEQQLIGGRSCVCGGCRVAR